MKKSKKKKAALKMLKKKISNAKNLQTLGLVAKELNAKYEWTQEEKDKMNDIYKIKRDEFNATNK